MAGILATVRVELGGHAMTDDDRVEEIRARAGAYHERLCERGMCATIRAEEYCLDIERLLAQYDALQAENDAIRKERDDGDEIMFKALAKAGGLEAENGQLREALHLLVVCIVERNPSHVQASMLGNAIDTACKALGKPWGFWREGGR